VSAKISKVTNITPGLPAVEPDETLLRRLHEQVRASAVGAAPTEQEVSMRRFWSNIAFSLLVAALLAAGLPVGSAFAGDNEDGTWTLVGGQSNSDGSKDETFQNDDDKYSYSHVHTDADGNVTITFYRVDPKFDPTFPNSNPSPDDNKGQEPPNVEAIIEAAAKAGKTYTVPVAPVDSPQLNKLTNGSGANFDAHWNPGDETDHSGGTPTLNSNKKTDPNKLTPAQQALLDRITNELGRTSQAIGHSASGEFGDVGEERPGLDLNGKYNNGSKSGNGKGNSNDKNRIRPGTAGEALGPRPDLVNPPLEGKVGKTGKASIAKSGFTAFGTGKTDIGKSYVGAVSTGTSDKGNSFAGAVSAGRSGSGKSSVGIATSTKSFAGNSTGLAKTDTGRSSKLSSATSFGSAKSSGGKIIGAGLLEGGGGFGQQGPAGMGAVSGHITSGVVAARGR
jgi:hypothetical protein